MNTPSRRPRIPLASRRLPMPAALRLRDFRLLMASSFFDSIGFMGEQVVVGWLVLELTDNSFMVGVVLGLRFAPLFFLGIVAGAIADMLDRRSLIRVLYLIMAAVMISVGALIYADALKFWHLCAFAVLGGCVSSLHQTARQSFAFDVAGRQNAVSGLAYVSLGMRLGGLAGGALVGVCIDRYGSDAAYIMLAIAYIISIAIISLIRSRGQAAPEQRRAAARGIKEPARDALRDVWAFLTGLRHSSALMMLMVIVAATEIMGFSSAVAFPELAREELQVGASGLGLMNAVRSAGAVAAIILLALFGEVRRKGALLLLTVVIFGAALLLLGKSGDFALTQNGVFVLALIAIAVIGGAMALSDVFSQSLMQSIVPNEQRGRAMGAWAMGIGTAPIGSLQYGAAVAALGVGFALTANGIALTAIPLAIALLYPRIRRI